MISPYKKEAIIIYFSRKTKLQGRKLLKISRQGEMRTRPNQVRDHVQAPHPINVLGCYKPCKIKPALALPPVPKNGMIELEYSTIVTKRFLNSLALNLGFTLKASPAIPAT